MPHVTCDRSDLERVSAIDDDDGGGGGGVAGRRGGVAKIEFELKRKGGKACVCLLFEHLGRYRVTLADLVLSVLS